MRNLSYRFAVVWLIAVSAGSLPRAKAEGWLDPFSGEVPETQIPRLEPEAVDFLVPVDPNPGDWDGGYRQQIWKHFELEASSEIWMLVRPSFSSEYVVSLQKNKESAASRGSKETYHLVHYRCTSEKNIWYSMPENNSEKRQEKVTVKKTTSEFPGDLAVRVEKIWNRMLLRTRRDANGLGGCDGTTFEFSTRTIRGETWSPSQRKSPLLFVELGHSLISYCDADDSLRAVARKRIEEKAAALERYLDKHP